MRTKAIISFMLILLIMLTFAGLAGAQIESPTYVTPPGPPTLDIDPDDIDRDDPDDVDRIATPPTSGGMAVGYSVLIGLLLITSSVPFLRK